MRRFIQFLLDRWLDPLPVLIPDREARMALADLSSTRELLTTPDIEAYLAERALQSHDRVNPYV